jgi:hypothetical protein
MAKTKRRRIHWCGCSTCQRHLYSTMARQHAAINRVLVTLDEKNRRRFTGLLAIQWGRRSFSLLSRITGLSRHTIRRGKREIERPSAKGSTRIRQPGGGRLPVEKNSPGFFSR